MKWGIRQHIPAFVDTDIPPEEGEFSTADEMEAIDFLGRQKKWPGFLRFSVAENEARMVPYLMAEYADGKFYVVGYLSGIPDFLPRWVASKESHA